LRAYPKLLLILIVLALPSIGWGQASAERAPTLRVTGPSGQSIALSFSDLKEMPRDVANVTDEKGAQVVYGGVPLIEILRRVGTPTGNDLRGKQMTLYLLVTASDGYHAVFALAELDPVFTDRRVLLVDMRNGKPLADTEGPFRIIAPGEKRHARWVHNVTSLSVETAH